MKSVKAFGVRRVFIISLALALIILVSLVAHSYFSISVENPVYAASDQEAQSVDKALVSANSMFGFNLFKDLVSGNPENVFISPLSISLALAMTYNGADGGTKDAMSKTLSFGDMSLNKVNEGFSELTQSLQNVDQSVQLLIGDSVWTSQDFQPYVNQSFNQAIQSSYGGEMFTRDFGSSQTVNDINGWVSTKTQGKINQIIQNIDPSTVMILINAIYFKGTWVTSFNKNETSLQDFYASPGNTTRVDMMTTCGSFKYYTGENCQVARLPYGRDKVSMYIFLPNQNISLNSFITSMNQTINDEYIGRLQSVDNLIIELPKFNVEYSANLNNALTSLGMGTAFDPATANFGGMSSRQLYISFVDHKAFVEVNEEGTEAAAATRIDMSYGVGEPHIDYHYFTVNRPFFFEIRDDRSSSILFMGAISSPTD